MFYTDAANLNWWEIWRICVCFVYCFSRKWKFFRLGVRKKLAKLRIDAISDPWPRREPTHEDYAPILSRSRVSAASPEDITEVKTKESGQRRDQNLFNLFGSGTSHVTEESTNWHDMGVPIAVYRPFSWICIQLWNGVWDKHNGILWSHPFAVKCCMW